MTHSKLGADIVERIGVLNDLTPMNCDEAKAELIRDASIQFDPRVVKVFLKILEEEEGKLSLEEKD